MNVHLEARSGDHWVSGELGLGLTGGRGEGWAALSRARVFLETPWEQAVPVPAGA